MFSCFIRESLFQYWSDIIGVALHIFHFQLFVLERGYYQGITKLQLLLLEAKLGLTERSIFFFIFYFNVTCLMINLVIEYIERNDNVVNMPSNQNSLRQNNT